jgi:hypothetical protein
MINLVTKQGFKIVGIVPFEFNNRQKTITEKQIENNRILFFIC